MNPSLLYRHQWNATDLLAEHPPRFSCERKRRGFELARPSAAPPSGRVSVSRWQAEELPGQVDVDAALRQLEVRPGYFTYDPSPAGRVDWHVNFAHLDAFAFYGTSLFAQDEWQVAEHPLLACVREALLSRPTQLLTLEDDRATPLLVWGAERWCAIATDADASAGRPNGLYGQEFGRASLEAIERAVHQLATRTETHVIAIAAPSYGEGAYRLHELREILATAYAGFRAAVIESEIQRGRADSVCIHTGFWGCGAFGGNRIVMTALQVLAVGMAGATSLVFHHGSAAGRDDVEGAVALLCELSGEESAEGLLRGIQSRCFEWGVSNGT